ncbi:MAG TPA: hypothetical protein VGU24_11040 [Microvirga sp.]|jgi:hypothetical protein|nr:hypothetical protein [Microvirga sp.]
MRALAAAVASTLLFAAPASAQSLARPEIIRGLCQKDGCDEFSVLSAEQQRSSDEGTLFRTRVRTYHSSSQGRAEKGDDTGYVFCSPTKPTILAEADGKVAGFQIATAPTQESRETKRQQANFYAMYFTICHGPEAGRAAVQNMEGVAQQYGYRSPLAKSVMVTFSNPQEVFSRPAQGIVRQAEERATPERLLRSSPSGDLLPPRNVPDPRERVMERRPAAQEEPWFREPQRWIESLNPF